MKLSGAVAVNTYFLERGWKIENETVGAEIAMRARICCMLC